MAEITTTVLSASERDELDRMGFYGPSGKPELETVPASRQVSAPSRLTAGERDSLTEQGFYGPQS